MTHRTKRMSRPMSHCYPCLPRLTQRPLTGCFRRALVHPGCAGILSSPPRCGEAAAHRRAGAEPDEALEVLGQLMDALHLGVRVECDGRSDPLSKGISETLRRRRPEATP